ncbi:MAG: DUF6786 family protein [Cyclobacteriaceae bacterium]
MKRLSLSSLVSAAAAAWLLMACSPRPSTDAVFERGTFAYDQQFMMKYKPAIVLGTASGTARVLVVPGYQARVMTSSSAGDGGRSYGWINYSLVESGKIPPHIYPVGGEDRFWLGPEGGQFAIYFKKGDPFDFDHWQTPGLIDTAAYNLVASDSTHAVFHKEASVTNYSGTTFQVAIDRTIALLSNSDFESEFGVSPQGASVVAYQSHNVLRNKGQDWSKKDGLLSIWILGMFNPSPATTIILPHDPPTTDSGVATDYFGPIPPDRVRDGSNVLLFRGDGGHRGKVGIAPAIARNVAGSYDSIHHVLTLVKFDVTKDGDYVNSKWEMQEYPFKGDAVNAYNDGPLADGSQMGPFYEIESSSAVRELKTGESLQHKVVTAHLEGDKATLDRIARTVLGVSLNDINIQ